MTQTVCQRRKFAAESLEHMKYEMREWERIGKCSSKQRNSFKTQKPSTFYKVVSPRISFRSSKRSKKRQKKTLERWMGRRESHPQNSLFCLSAWFAWSNITTHSCKCSTGWNLGLKNEANQAKACKQWQLDWFQAQQILDTACKVGSCSSHFLNSKINVYFDLYQKTSPAASQPAGTTQCHQQIYFIPYFCGFFWRL